MTERTPEEERERLARGIPPDWADSWGHDEYGVFVGFRIGDAEQRMRYVAPGRFVMGSPQDEPGRWDDEGPQHDVELTRGTWLADTPCTQALWQAVMGDNPSRFVSPRRPVEQVSWDDAQRFLGELGKRVPGVRLPTEAQWEHACRAGTTTATYAGPIVIRGDNDAPVLDAIAWYGGNSGVGFELDNGYDSSGWPDKQHAHTRAGTREVATKRPNAWGLYDMLGNVWEWCADWRGPYDGGPATDPEGPPRGAGRVVRGGGWFSLARLCRAALRVGLEPGNRLDGLGFRFLRGQGLRQAAEP